MTKIKFKIGESDYQITCDEERKSELLRLAEKLDERFKQLALDFKNFDEKTLLVTTALMIEEELEEEIKKNEENKEMAESNRINDQQLQEAVSENIENIADYIEKLTKKIHKNY